MAYGGWNSLADKRADEAHKARLAATSALQVQTSREQRRYEIAREVVAAVHTNEAARERALLDARNSCRPLTEEVAGFAVQQADALLAALE